MTLTTWPQSVKIFVLILGAWLLFSCVCVSFFFTFHLKLRDVCSRKQCISCRTDLKKYNFVLILIAPVCNLLMYYLEIVSYPQNALNSL